MPSKIITFYPVMQGVGCKYTATGFAFMLSQMYPKSSIALVDFDFKNPYLAEHLSGHDKVHGIDNLISKIDGNFLTNELFMENMTKIPGLFDILKGTELVGRDHLITQKHIDRIIELLRKNYEYIVIAVSPGADNAGTVYGLYNADEVVMITRINYACYINLPKATNLVIHFKKARRINLVYNMYTDNFHLDFTALVQENGLNVIGGLPYDESTIDNHNISTGIQAKIANKIAVRYNETLRAIVVKLFGLSVKGDRNDE